MSRGGEECLRKAAQRSNQLPISLEELSCGTGTAGASLQTPPRFRNRCRANREDEDQLLVGVCLRAIWLLRVRPFANATVPAHPLVAVLSVLALRCVWGV